MASVIPNEGQEWVSQKIMGNLDSEYAYEIAVGTGTASPTTSDTSLSNEIYRANSDDSIASISLTSSSGGIQCRITITGGTEVPSGSKITEFGLFVNNGSTMLYREVRSSVKLDSGERQTFEFTLDVEN